ncbi:hypothetical protein [Nicoliella lavandulae]|uniref:Lipoprotein n=1 Tax=Nicoliella lavandulae TaxID=3082954 RepID=A0ABU8SMU6_9LACO
MKTKLILSGVVLSLLLAGCGNTDGQFSGRPNSVAKVVAKSKQSAKEQSEKNAKFDKSQYQAITKQNISDATNKNQITVAKAQTANLKLYFDGVVKAISKSKADESNILVTHANRSYLIYGATSIFKGLKVGDHVTTYGSGLALIKKHDDKLGINSNFINSQTLIFNADQISTK